MVVQRRREAEHAGLLRIRLLQHNADACGTMHSSQPQTQTPLFANNYSLLYEYVLRVSAGRAEVQTGLGLRF